MRKARVALELVQLCSDLDLETAVGRVVNGIDMKYMRQLSLGVVTMWKSYFEANMKGQRTHAGTRMHNRLQINMYQPDPSVIYDNNAVTYMDVMM